MKKEDIKPVSPKGSEILKKLLFFAEKENGYFKLDKTEEIFIPLTIEILWTSEKLIHFSICHYGEQIGDLMCDPEMIFVYWNDKFYPTYFKNDYVGKEDTSLQTNEMQITGINRKIYSGHLEFAEIWLKNIKEQQNI